MIRFPLRRSKDRATLLCAAVIGVLLVASLAVLFSAPSSFGRAPVSASPTDAGRVHLDSTENPPQPADAPRLPTLWPFSRDSIWNLPIGANAVYVPGNIQQPSAYGMTTDVDVLILTPTAPITPVYYNSDAWSGGSRCDAQGGVLFSAPIPTDFVIPGAGGSNPDGTTPNYATAILRDDGHTLIQGQPSARCTAGGTATMWWYQENEDLLGTGNSGAHGGSMLSSLGGVIRLGELVPGGTIRHAMKVNLLGADNYYSGSGGYRWPATTADGCAPGCYGGSVPALRMGSLLALPPSFDVNAMGLETDAAKILARAFQDYGAYTVDDAAWSVYAIATEYSPSGKVDTEFETAWGFTPSPASRNVPWARDMDRIFGNLHVVDNWNQATWQTVSASNGTLGAGLGAPRVSWAPEFGEGVGDTIPPVSTASLSGTSGAGNWYLSPVDVTITATDSDSGVAAIHVRTDGGTWQTYTSPLTIQGEGAHSIEYYATDLAGNDGTQQTKTFQIDTVAPVSAAQVSGQTGGEGSYLSPVQVTLTSTDATSGVDSIGYRIDGGAWRTYAEPFPVAGNGTHALDYFATDVAGNDEGIRTQSIRLTGATHTPPISALSSTGTTGLNGWYVSAVTVTLTATGTAGSTISIAYQIDSGSWTTYQEPIAIPEGRHTLQYQASDSEGYIEPAKSASFQVDYTPPAIVKTTPTGDVMPRDGVLSWSGTDSASGIAGYEVGIDGGLSESIGLQTSVSRSWTIGPHVAIVKAKDRAGNEATSTMTFRVDPQSATPTGPLETTATGTLWIAIGVILLVVAVLSLPKRKGRRGPHSASNRRERSSRRERGNRPDVSENRDSGFGHRGRGP